MKIFTVALFARVAAQVTAKQAFNNDDLKLELNKYCTNHTWINETKYGLINEWDVSQVTSMENLFREKHWSRDFSSCNPPIQDWNVTNVQNFWCMFCVATSFNQDISQWDVSRGTDFGGMFDTATSFDQDISNWDVSRGTHFEYMFSRATSIDQDISQWDVSRGTDFRGMFNGATLFDQDISNWDVSQGTNFKYMFYGATSFNQDISQWDVSRGTNFAGMFRIATSFNQDISNWDVSQGTNFEYMFYGATSFDQDLSQWPQAARDSCINGAHCTAVPLPLHSYLRNYHPAQQKFQDNCWMCVYLDCFCALFGKYFDINDKVISQGALE